MTDHRPSEPTPADFKEAADKSQQAGIADEGAAYSEAIAPTEESPAAAETGAHPS